MQFVLLGLLVVFVIGFLVVVWKAAQAWRWYHITAAVLLMLLTVAFLFPTAMVLKSRAAWHQTKENLEARFQQVKAENERLKFGDLSDPEAGPGLLRLKGQLAKIDLEAGRRARNLQLQNVADQEITLAVPEPAADIPGAAPPAAAATEPLLPVEQIVYGFAEVPNPEQILVPDRFLGEFVVTASTPTTATIRPTAPLEASQLQAIENREATHWSLYELLPLDGHAMFIAPGSTPSDENFLGRVDDALVNRLLGDRVSPETLQSYLRDGSRSTADDPPLSRWTKVEFEKPFTFDVDSQEQRSALDGGFFDGSGRAVDGRLQKGEEVKFSPGDQIVIKEEAADQLIDEGLVRLIDQYYLRPLNDYRYILRRIRLRLTGLANRIEDLQSEYEILRSAADKTQGMLVVNQDIKLKLEQDFQHFRTERQAISEHVEVLRQQSAQMRAEMKRLHQENLALERRLDAYHRALTRTPAEQDVAVVR